MMLSRLSSSVHVRSVFNACRGLATNSAAKPATEVKFQDEWNNAKPYKDIPGPTAFGIFRHFMPGGEVKALNIIGLINCSVTGKYCGLGMIQFYKWDLRILVLSAPKTVVFSTQSTKRRVWRSYKDSRHFRQTRDSDVASRWKLREDLPIWWKISYSCRLGSFGLLSQQDSSRCLLRIPESFIIVSDNESVAIPIA